MKLNKYKVGTNYIDFIGGISMTKIRYNIVNKPKTVKKCKATIKGIVNFKM